MNNTCIVRVIGVYMCTYMYNVCCTGYKIIGIVTVQVLIDLMCTQGLLSLTNGTTIEGTFGGRWHKKIEIVKATLEDGEKVQEDTDSAHAAISELQ